MGHSDLAEHAHTHELTVKQVDRLSPTKVRLTVEISSENVRSHEQSIANRYVRSVRIPGFRPGKAPVKMVREKYRDDIQRDLVSHLLEAGIHEAIGKTKLVPISRPKVQLQNVEEGKPFGFQAEFEVEPEIDLKNYKGIPLKKSPIEISNEEISKTIDTLRDRMATLEPVESSKAEKGLFGIIEVSYVTKDGFDKMDNKSFTVELGADKLLPAIEKSLLTLSVGESKEVEEIFPENYSEKKLSGKAATFQVKLVELKRKVMPTADDVFAGQLREGLTLDKLKEEISSDIRNSKEEEAKQTQRQAIVEYLIEKNHFEVPQSMVEEQSAQLLQNVQEDLKRRGINPPPLKPDEAKSVWEKAERLVRSSMLLREVASKENLTLDEQRLSARIDVIATQLNQSVEDTKKYLNGKGLINRLRDEILTDQVFDFLIGEAKIS